MNEPIAMAREAQGTGDAFFPQVGGGVEARRYKHSNKAKLSL